MNQVAQTKNGGAVEAAVAEPSRYAIMTVQEEGVDLPQLIQDNLGGETLRPHDLEKIVVPPGGTTTWTYQTIEGEQETKELMGIVLFASPSRGYWPEGEAGNVPPQCASDDGVIGVGDPGGHCKTCELNQFGSGKNGSKACKETKHLYVLMRDTIFPHVIQIPPKSLGLWTKYVAGLTGLKKSVNGVVTKFTLEKTQSNSGHNHGLVKFHKAADLSPQQQQVIRAYRDEFMPLITMTGGNGNGQSA